MNFSSKNALTAQKTVYFDSFLARFCYLVASSLITQQVYSPPWRDNCGVLPLKKVAAGDPEGAAHGAQHLAVETDNYPSVQRGIPAVRHPGRDGSPDCPTENVAQGSSPV